MNPIVAALTMRPRTAVGFSGESVHPFVPPAEAGNEAAKRNSATGTRYAYFFKIVLLESQDEFAGASA
jgi:hypothetical protein